MRFPVFAAMAVVLTGVAAAGNVPAPSFDCAKASTPVDKLICADADLATADAILAGEYRKIVSAYSDLAAGLRDGQRAFLSARAPCLTGTRATQIACLKERYAKRLAALRSPNLLACAKPALNGATFHETCIALNNPLQIHLGLSGQKHDMDAQLATLVVTTSRGTQTFKLDGRIFFEGLGTAPELMDVNFDGFADIKLATSTSAGPNMGFDYWLFDPKSGGFVASNLGEQLSGFDVTPDPQAKTIAVNGRSSCCSWNVSTYAWKGNALVLRTSEDSGEFSPTDLPVIGALDQMLCGREAKHFNDAGLITRIDIGIGPDTGSECSKEAMSNENELLAKLKGGKGFRIELSKITGRFSILFDKPKKVE